MTKLSREEVSSLAAQLFRNGPVEEMEVLFLDLRERPEVLALVDLFVEGFGTREDKTRSMLDLFYGSLYAGFLADLGALARLKDGGILKAELHSAVAPWLTEAIFRVDGTAEFFAKLEMAMDAGQVSMTVVFLIVAGYWLGRKLAEGGGKSCATSPS